MVFQYYRDDDILYIKLAEGTSTESFPLTPNLSLKGEGDVVT
ncbi:MAG: hypothetical protein WCA08_20890 [Desulfoferrobacter sp.]